MCLDPYPTPEKKPKPKPSNAPLYCAIYPELATSVRKHGYALSIHGSLARDFDLVCIPWIKYPSTPESVIAALQEEFALKPVGEPGIKEHGRMVYTMIVSYGECFLDLSFMPLKRPV